ncbi:MAG: 4Fe-4S binding protein [Sedimentisphaerales bacterium]|nr:4Fe-4S binding protein [Sedimentisphaerales bacterium]
MSVARKHLKAAIFILAILTFLNLAPECFAESVTKRDLADVLPTADAFARKTEPFEHFLGYTTDGGYLMGVVFLTTEVVPEESWGYRDQIATLVGVNANGEITGVKVLSEFESPRYTKGLLADESWFLKQFEEKDASDNFILEGDVDAITGATITSSAVTRSIKAGLELVAEQILNKQVAKDNPVEHLYFQHLLWQKDFIFLWIMVGLAFWSFFKKKESLRYFILGLSFAYLGILMGGGFSTNDILRLLSGHNPVFLNNLYWYSLVIIAIGLTIFAGRFYCGWLCPFGATLEVLYRLVPIKRTITGEADRYLKVVKYVNLGILLMIGLLLGNNILAIYLVGIIEPFATFFNLHGDLISWMWLILMLVFSSVVSRFYCRYFCPLGAFFALLSGLCSLLGLRLIKVNLPQDNCKGCRLAQKRCQMNAISYDEELERPSIDGNECFMCNTCAAICPVESKKL